MRTLQVLGIGVTNFTEQRLHMHSKPGLSLESISVE